MADVSVKMGVSGIAQFKQGMKEAEAATKTLDAAMKSNEKQFQRTGDAESHLAAQTTLLNQKMTQQRNIIKNAEAALKQMRDNGVKETSTQFQNMQRRLIEAQSTLMDTEDQLNHLGETATQTAEKTDKLESSLSGLNKKISLDQVITGIGKISSGLENAAKKAAQVADGIFSAVMDSARWSDDTATQAMLLDMSVEKYQQYKGVFDTIGELTVADWAKAKRKVEKAITDPSNDQIDVLRALGFTEKIGGKYGTEEVVKIADNWEQAFWDASRALKQKVESGQLSLEQADMLGEALFGRNYSALKPLIELGQTGFQEALTKQNIASEEAIKKDAELNDAVIKLQNSYTALKAEVTSGLAPALTTAANALDSLLGSVLEYLQTEDGQKMMEEMANAVSELFSGLEDVSAEDVVSGFKDVFDTVLGVLQWIVDNKDAVVTALEAIFGIWTGLTITEGILTVVKVVDGLKGLLGTGAAQAGAAGSAAGGAWGSGFAAAVMKAAPWLIGLYTLLDPASSATNDTDLLFDEKTHELTTAGKEAGIRMSYDEYMNWKASMHEPMYSAEGQADFLWKNQLEYGNAWVRVTQNQYDAVQKFYDYFRTRDIEEDITEADWAEFEKAFEGQENLFDLVNEIFDHFTQTQNLKDLPEDLPEDFFKIAVLPEVPENAAEEISQQIGTVKVGVDFLFGQQEHYIPGLPRGYANGINYVPFDGFPAILHKGERVVPARAMAASRNYSSNLYVESMYMNSGTDAEGLASAMAAAQRRTMSGYGS